MKKIEEILPDPKQPIKAKIIDGYSGKEAIVLGIALSSNPEYVLLDFWSGTGAEKIIEWEPRIPSGKDGHPYTSIERLGK